ncbi:MAG: right-handed parallel beta-helix repeat-containing protein [Hyphomicrobium sp.]
MKPVAAALRLLIGLFVFGSLAAIPATAATTIARTTSIPKCAVFVDAANAAGGAGTLAQPHATIAAAIAAAPPGAVICVAEGTYAESLSPGEKYFTLAGGFQRGSAFAVRDSAKYVTRAQGKGGSFVRFEDPSPSGDKLVAIDGFEITGYAQAIFREFYESQRFDITNNFIHGNSCADQSLAGAGFALNNVSGNIRGNVIQGNACGRGGAGFINDTTNKNTVLIEGNLIDGNAGTEPGSSHGGALYLFVNRVTVLNNTFTRNSVTQWGAASTSAPTPRAASRLLRRWRRTSTAATKPATAAAASSATMAQRASARTKSTRRTAAATSCSTAALRAQDRQPPSSNG